MRSKASCAALFIACCLSAFGQGKGKQQPPPPTDKVTPEIPGIVKAGTPIEIIKFGLRGSDGLVGMPDGSVVLSGNGSVLKIGTDGTMSTLVENSENAAGLALDSKG